MIHICSSLSYTCPTDILSPEEYSSNPEDGGHIFVVSVGLSPNFMALQPRNVRRQNRETKVGSSCLVKGTEKTQDYWVFGLCPTSGILKNTKVH
jgi:hypothetical protein